jgi:hypothetical protein
MNISGFRSLLYWLAQILGDLQAIRKDRIGQRVLRRTAGKVTGKMLSRLFK